MREHGSEVLPTRHESGQPELSTVCAQRVRWGPLVMRGVSLIGVSQAEAGYTVTVTVDSIWWNITVRESQSVPCDCER